MILSLDVGNSQIYGGLCDGDVIQFQFRKTTKSQASSDEIGVFLRTVLRENNFDPKGVRQIALCSVVPEVVHSIKGACKKYFNINPFILQPGSKTGLRIKYRNPLEVGADRIANAIGATSIYPQKNLIIVDLGTATTFCALTKQKDYLGGVIVPGLRLSMESLELNTSKLPSVEIVKPIEVLGRGTVESIQSGLYYGHLGMMREMIQRLSEECFEDKPLVIGTGGFSHLFEEESVFDSIHADLVIKGLLTALRINT